MQKGELDEKNKSDNHILEISINQHMQSILKFIKSKIHFSCYKLKQEQSL